MARKSIIQPPAGVTPATAPQAEATSSEDGAVRATPEIARSLYPDLAGVDGSVNAYKADKRQGVVTEAASADGKFQFTVETFWNA